MYRGKAEFFYYANWEQAEVEERKADVILVDPELTIRDSYTSVQMKRWMAEGNPLLICAPERRKSLVRELKSVGIETGAPIPEETAGPDLYQNQEERKPEEPARPVYRHVFGIVELTREADAGLITMMMAEELASEMQEDHGLVTVFAPQQSCFYYSLGLESKLGEAGFQRLDEYLQYLMEKEGIDDSGEVPNFLEGISWLTATGHVPKGKEHEECAEPQEAGKNAAHPEHGDPFGCSENRGAAVCAEDAEHSGSKESPDNAGNSEHCAQPESSVREQSRTEVIRKLQGNVLLCCYSAEEFEKDVREAADCLEAVLVVADARPSSLMEGSEHLNLIRESGLPVVFAVSRMNRSVRQPLVSQILQTEEIIWVPEIDSAVRYEAEYQEENPYRFEEIRKVMMLPVSQMIDRLKAAGTDPSSDVCVNVSEGTV